MIKIVHTGTGAVFYATPYSAGFDICANESNVLHPGARVLVSTGLFLVNAQKDFDLVEKINKGKTYSVVPELQIRSRSGLAWKNGVVVLNSPGTVDFDYLQPNEIKVMLINHGHEDFLINPGDRIAQGVVALTMRAPGIEIKEDKRQSGFGSTGVASEAKPVS